MDRPHPHGKLRNKLFVVIALVSVVPLLFAGIISYFSITASHRIDVANLEDTLLDQKLGETQSIWNSMVIRLQPGIVSNTTNVLDGGARIPFLKQIFASGQSVGLQEVTLVDLGGKELARITADQPDGVASGTLADDAGASWFPDAAAGKVLPETVFFSNGEPMMSVAAPVRSNGAIIDVLRGTFQLSAIQDSIQSVSLGDTGYVYLVDGNGEVMVSNVSGPAATADMSGVGFVKQVVAGRDFSGPGGQSRYKNFMGSEVIAAAKFIPQFGWGLIAEWPTQEADASVNDIIYKNAWVLCGALIAVILVSIVLAALIVRPVRRLEDGTALVAEGKFDAEVNIRTGDELEDLGASFNKMIVGLRRLEELKNEFVFVAAHELRTPVAAMKGYLTLILEGITGPITDQTKDFMEKVVRSNERLGQLVNDLLEISRSESGKLTIKVAPIDVVQPIRSVLAELKPLAEKASVQMVYAPSSDLSKVLADEERLKEVMVNLVGNAIKYMGAAGTVTVFHEPVKRELVIHVKDTGLGIAKDAQEKLFEKFYRVATDKTKGIEGTGLGLFIVKEIVEKMNGKIWVESEEGKGSIFSFSLPLA